MKTQRRVLFWLLVFMTVLGSGLVFNTLISFVFDDKVVNLLFILELGCIGLLVAPFVAKLPSGASWRSGIPLMMMGMFLVRPAFVVIVPIAGLILITARARGAWWRYFETIAHVALGLYAGVWTLAAHMGLKASMLNFIFRSGLGHDVGKIGVPDAILNKQENYPQRSCALFNSIRSQGTTCAESWGFPRTSWMSFTITMNALTGAATPPNYPGTLSRC